MSDEIRKFMERSMMEAMYLDLIRKSVGVNEEDYIDTYLLSKEDLKSLIDLALVNGDKEWFMELTNKLAVMI